MALALCSKGAWKSGPPTGKMARFRGNRDRGYRSQQRDLGFKPLSKHLPASQSERAPHKHVSHVLVTRDKVPHSLVVRTFGFHPKDRGSNPRGEIVKSLGSLGEVEFTTDFESVVAGSKPAGNFATLLSPPLRGQSDVAQHHFPTRAARHQRASRRDRASSPCLRWLRALPRAQRAC